MASVRQTSDGNRIEVRLWHRGREYSTTTEFTKTALTRTRRIANKLQARLSHGEPWENIRAEIRGETVELVTVHCLDHYMQHVFLTSNASIATLKKARRDYARVWQPDFGQRRIDNIVRSELQVCLAKFGYTPSTQRDMVSLLRQAFAVAESDGVIERSPIVGWKIKGRSTPRDRASRAYTPAQRDLLLGFLKREANEPNSIEETAWRFFTLAFYTGMRTEELLAISRPQLREYEILINQVRTDNRLIQTTKSKNSERIVEVPRHVWDLVVEPWKHKEWLFTGPKGRPFTQGNKMTAAFQAAHEATGIPRPMNSKGTRPMPYAWRSTYISLAIKFGMDKVKVAQQVGDDPRTIFDHYVEYIECEDSGVRMVDRIFC